MKRSGVAAALLTFFLALPAGAGCQACPQPNCWSPWITELGMGPYIGFSGADPAPFLVALHAGYLRSQGNSQAIGGSLLAGANRIGPFAGFEARYRRWLTTAFTVDAGLGIVPFADGAFGSVPLVGSLAVGTRSLGVAIQVQPLKDVRLYTTGSQDTEIVSAIALQLRGKLGGTSVLVLLALLGYAFATWP